MATILTFYSFFSIAFAITVFIISLSTFSLIEATNGGFSVDLIHRDSPKSPLFNPSLTPSQRVINALRRSVNRVSRFEARSVSPNTVSTEVISANGEYLMRMFIGTPPFEILAIADTGSDLIWTQCKPCSRCFRQKAPLFDPKNSSTYREVSCNARQCLSLRGTSCRRSCQYSVMYGDQSFSHGALATETITLGSNIGRHVSLARTIFGCGHDDGGTFSSEESGIIGLGGGKVSLISQMGSSINGKFSYCLMPFSSSKSSRMNFGDSGLVSGSRVVSTPIVPNFPATFYYLTLEGISVGSKRLNFYNSSSSSSSSDASSEGNIIIDSGTTLTFLPLDFYMRLESAVRNAIQLRGVEDPEQILNLCYKTNSTDDFVAPIITVHFKGADVKLNPSNTFVETSESVICLAFAPSSSLAIFGNLAQMNFLVGYDLQKKTVSFKPTNCVQH